MRILLWIAAAVLGIVIAVAAFLRLYPQFGGRPGRSDRADYAKRAAGYFDGKHFVYPSEWNLPGAAENRKVSQKGTVPADKLPVETPDLTLTADDDVWITWLGHASSLIQMHGRNILIDPVFSQRSSPFPWIGPKRFTNPGFTVDNLPAIDAVLITHDHYDHLDMATVVALKQKTARFIVPLGVEKHIARWIQDDSSVISLAWWEHYDLGGLEIHCTPSNHRSGRAVFDYQNTLVCSWALCDEKHRLLESSDTGYGGHFAAIHDRLGDFDLFMPDSGQYNINWHFWHMFPEESAMAAETLGAKAVMPIHWGAFVLSDHGWDDSPERITAACGERGIAVITPKLCETVSLSSADHCRVRWWRDYQ